MRLHLACALVASAAMTTTAFADPSPTPEPPLPQKREGTGYGTFVTGTPGPPHTLLDGPHFGIRVLTDFSFKFAQGDRRLRKLSLALGNDYVRGEFAPHISYNNLSKNHPFRWRVSVDFLDKIPIESDVKGQCKTFENCKGECTVEIRARPPGHHFVLGGFNFYRDGEANVRRVSVLPNPASKNVLIRFQDNGNPSFKGEICYSYVHDRWFQGAQQQAQFAYEPGKPVPKKLIGRHRLALAGFDFEFQNGDHHVSELAIVYDRPYLTARFFDQNTDDPWRASVWYELFKP